MCRRSSAVADRDDDALNELFGNICHQGTVYEATAYAVTFLVELLDGPSVDRPGVLGLLSEIADGSSYTDVHKDFLPRTGRWAGDLDGRIEQEMEWVRAARAAVAAGAPTYLRLLADDADADVRAWAAHTLGRSAQAADPVLRAVLAGAENDGSPLVRASLILAAQALAAATATRIAGWLSDQQPRWRRPAQALH